MKKIICGIALATLTGIAAHANLIGTTVTGSLTSGSSFNGFDPNNGLVPAGFLNSLPGTPTVHVSGTATEFGYYDTVNFGTVDLTSGGFTVKDVTTAGWMAFQIKLTDTAFAGLTLSELSDTFGSGGASASLSGNTITINVPAFTARYGGSYSATYNLTGTTNRVPDGGSSIAMVAAGLGLLMAVRSRKSLIA